MVLLNIVRVLITLVAMALIETFRRAWQIEGLGLLGIVAFGMLLAFIAGDLAEAWLLDYFDKGEADAGHHTRG